MIGSNDKERAKYDIAYNLFRYTSSYENKFNDFPKLFSRLWSADIDMKDPSSGWGTRIHKIVFPLTGYNVGKIPQDAKGYQMDNRCDANVVENGRAYSSTFFEKFRVDAGDEVEASVFCLVSKDFNGDSVFLKMEGDIKGKLVSDYEDYKDLKYRRSKDENILYNGDFRDSLVNWENYYAFSTTHKIVDTPFGKGVNIARTSGNEDWSLSYVGRPIMYHAGHEYKFVFYFRTIKGNAVPFQIGWWVNDGQAGYERTLSLPLSLRSVGNSWYEASCSYRFKEDHTLLQTFLNSLQANSEIELADIRLYDLDSDESSPAYLDEISPYWQKLRVKGTCNKGSVEISLNFSQKDVSDFKSLDGSVIFAYPQINVIRNEAIIPVYGQLSYNEVDSCYMWRYNQNLESLSISETTKMSSFILAELYNSLKISSAGMSIQDTTETDLIRSFTNNLISEDTTYFGFRSDLAIKRSANRFFGARLDRWRFSMKIFFKEYNWTRKLFGGGFNFLNWFSYYFNGDKSKTDHPHNPFLSILLFSGILGFGIYLMALFFSIKYYFKHLRDFSILTVFFLITFFFTFFSGGSPFEPPVMGFFLILPYLIHSIDKKSVLKT